MNMQITSYSSTMMTMPRRTLPEPAGEGEWQVDLGGGFYAYVTADDADALAAGWTELAAELRQRDAELSEPVSA